MRNEILRGNCIEVMKDRIPDKSIDFVFSSPPYDTDKEYEERLGEKKWTEFMIETMKEVSRVLDDRGRFGIVVPFRSGEKTGRWSRLYATERAIDEAGLEERDLIVWNQRDIQGTAWGSWQSPSAPNIQYQTEYIVIGFKTRWSRDAAEGITISTEEFKDWTTSNLWKIRPDTQNEHPASFPEELVERCLKLFTYKEDTVLDPMIGSGTTAVVAKRLGRNWIGIEKEKKYYEMAKKRVRNTARYPGSGDKNAIDGQQGSRHS